MTTQSHKGTFIKQTIEEVLACIGFIFCIWIIISWAGVLGQQALSEWNFFRLMVELMLQYR